MDRSYEIPGGSLRFSTSEERMPLDDLLCFAARCNPLRPFLFVSKVLGRHIPVRPARMRETYRLLVEPMRDLPGPVWVIGMAETATGLGAGVADTLALDARRADVHFQHTTRLRVDAKRLLSFQESHSHAPTHLLYEPLPHLASAFVATRTLVIVDDEISTGRSVAELASRILAFMPQVERLVIASLVNWLDSERRNTLASWLARTIDSDIEVSWPSLLSGTFSFTVHADAPVPVLPADVEAARPGPLARDDLGRRGVALPAGGLPYRAPPLHDLDHGRELAVIGTGELAFQPFLLAEALEADGRSVTLQCTSRSPVLPGAAIRATLECPDPYDQGVGYYLHNPPAPDVFAITLCETEGRGAPALDAHQSLQIGVPVHVRAGAS